ncbi:dienelactone hydrolase family protein [Streptomyces sp. 4F14]|uniref:dienelactone hydrolase family protein n=1 Tax=Streptomyces sp. 4F14 TaxID=3394380 RepID=UPI003A85B6C3
MTAVEGMDLSVRTQDGAADAYFVRPDDSVPHSSVLFYTDVMGVRPSVKERADRLASAGYAVLVPNVFYRSTPAPVVEMPESVTEDALWSILDKTGPLVQALTPTDAMRDAVGWLDWLEASPHTSDGPVGVTGYCYGGMLCLRTAGGYPDRVAAAAIIHGSHLITEAPDSPHMVADRIRGEVFFANGDKDTIMTYEEIERFNEILSAAGVRYHSEMYAGAQHGFSAADLLPLYDKAADERHWAGLLDLFGRTL